MFALFVLGFPAGELQFLYNRVENRLPLTT